MKKNIGELELKILKKLLSYKDTTFSKEEGKILYDFLNNEKNHIVDEDDLYYINLSIEYLKNNNYVIDSYSRSDLRHNLFSIYMYLI
ncbi:hypothetical protein [Clostridium perfringens]|uniref:Uncharacterized protein n=1 Tax=Clostridium perfringens TaxID=1502 RepID=A0A2X2Y1M7_CLOPF|nr:hypothetical protein [Clostridium perfringens]ELC8463767.1 hypothetical protein [Clostridium perfringens]MCX0402172.1 hypothetical protein [Clostridium perfringens]NGT46606.1 hypothetical protein [Clostridium perfringens]SQB59818.1 Uncharacterised protein [Clostridium perfringens]